MGKDTQLKILRVDDFQVSGQGSASAWQRAQWQPLQPYGACAVSYATKAKMLYSDAGVYFLVDCEDEKITSTGMKDNDHLYNEDVVEMFLWTHEPQIVYFEYEISPLGAELPMLVAKHDGKHHGWLPWVYEKDRRIRKAAVVRGGPQEPGAKIQGWSCEVFIPFTLLKGLGNVPPQSGTQWRGNIYRIDYDKRPASHWVWSPLSSRSFHDYEHFGTWIFE